MPGKSSIERRALEAQSAIITGMFEDAGYDFIAPDILQPADVFLDRSGEDIRSRTFVFTAPDGTEQCLRPDLTVPTCRYHLTHAPRPGHEARYCYSGPAFRYQPGGETAVHPQEFDQAGIELFGAEDAGAADAEILALTLKALEAAGLQAYTVRTGDLGLFHGLLAAIDMPERWCRRLHHHFWRPRAFRSLLQVLTGAVPRARTSISPLIDRLDNGALEPAVDLTEQTLGERNLALVAGRALEEIAERLAEKAADRIETPLTPLDSERIDAYLAVRGTPHEVLDKINTLADDLGDAMRAAADTYGARLEHMAAAGLDCGSFEFAAVFGRALEYYTGFVFQVEVPDPAGGVIAIAGGGRYDNMLSDIGAAEPVPAVGCAIHTERLAAAVQGGGA
jgi:ATP phosphoribosyltransferase regulatory subunit